MSERKIPLKVNAKEEDYPSNSRREKATVEKQKVEKVISGKAVKKKKSLGKKMGEVFISDDVDSISDYILYDVIIPAAKNMISDTVTNGVSMLLFGTTRSKNVVRDRGRSYVPYSSLYDSRKQTQREVAPRNRARHNFDDIILEHRVEAEEVLSSLADRMELYGEATVADLYDLVGITSNFTDNKYGWDTIAGARVVRVRDGYFLDLPKPIVLD